MGNYIKTAAKGASVIFVMTVLASFVGYLIRMFLTRRLSPEDYGLFYAVFVFINLLWLFKHFGLSNSLIKYIPEFLVEKNYSKIKSAIVSVFLIEFCFASIITSVLIFSSRFLSDSYFRSVSAQSILVVLAFYFLVSVFTDTLVPVFLGFQKYGYYAIYILLLNSFVCIFTYIFIDEFGILAPAYGYLISSIILSILYIFLFLRNFSFFKYNFFLSKRLVKKLALFGLALLAAMISAKVIGYIDIVLLTYFRPLEDVGIYNVVLPTALLLIAFGNSLATVFFPMVSELWAKGMKRELVFSLRLVYKYAFILITPISLTILSFPEIVLRILFGEFYTRGALALQILIIGALCYTVAVVNISTLSGLGKPKLVTKIILIAAILNVIGNFILIPIFGINGAAFATSLSYLTILIMSSFILSKFIGLKIPWLSWFKVFLSGMIFVGTIYYLKSILNLSVWLKIITVVSLSLIVYIVSLFLFKLTNIKDLLNLKDNVFR